MKNYYLPILEKYTYYLPHVILLEKNETSADRSNNSRPGDIETSRNYADNLLFEKKNEIMSQNFRNHITILIKGAGLRHLKKRKKLTKLQ